MYAQEDLLSQRQLFPVQDILLDDSGFLSPEAIQRLKAIDKELNNKNLGLEKVTQISRESWNNWMYRRRAPSGPTLALLKVLLAHPTLVIETLYENVNVGRIEANALN